jgi:hypothetical protein
LLQIKGDQGGRSSYAPYSTAFPESVDFKGAVKSQLKWMYERLVEQIVAFEANMSPGEEIGGRLVTAPKEGIIHIEDIGYLNPDMLIFHGRDFEGRPIQLLQHHSQLSILLCVAPREKEQARRRGFILEAKLGR